MKDVRELVKVKPLEWCDWEFDEKISSSSADGYQITRNTRGTYDAEYDPMDRGDGRTITLSVRLQKAKLLCQKDYESRIYALLEIPE